MRLWLKKGFGEKFGWSLLTWVFNLGLFFNVFFSAFILSLSLSLGDFLSHLLTFIFYWYLEVGKWGWRIDSNQESEEWGNVTAINQHVVCVSLIIYFSKIRTAYYFLNKYLARVAYHYSGWDFSELSQSGELYFEAPILWGHVRSRTWHELRSPLDKVKILI